jgi:hypothetical protein
MGRGGGKMMELELRLTCRRKEQGGGEEKRESGKE